MNEFFEQTITELTRKGAIEKVKFLKSLRKKVMPSQLERVQQNDKGVLQELFLPKWVSWELLRAWADNYKVAGKGKTCVLCGSESELGVNFQEKFICESCFVRLKNLK